MNPLLIAAIVVVFGGSYVYIFMLQKKNKQVAKEYEAPGMIAQSQEFQNELLQRMFNPLAQRFTSQEIDAFTECAYITDLTSKTKSTLLTGLKVIGYSLIGVRATYTQAANAAYLVLIGEDLHYILFQEGELTDFFTMTRSQLQKAKIIDLSAVDKTTRVYSTIGDKVSKKLILDNNGKTTEIIFFDRVSKGTQGIPLSDSTTNIKDILGKCRVMGIRFQDKLKEQYPHLKH